MEEILEVHARNLSKPFDKMWIGRFRSFIKFVQTNPEAKKIVANFLKEKIQDHAAFIDASSTFTKELSQYGNKVKKNIPPDEIISFEEKLKALQKLGRDAKEFQDYRFRVEDVFYKLSQSLSPILEKLSIQQKLLKILDFEIFQSERGVFQARF